MTDRPLAVLIVDDELPARSVLREMLSPLPGARIVGECSNGFEAVRMVTELHPDVLFLDIEMPKLNGFEVLELIDPAIAVVFVTAYDQYAVKAFEVRAVDYVLKPFSAQRIAEAFESVRLRAGKPRPHDASELAAAARPDGTFLQRIVVREGPRIHVIPVDSLDSVEAQDDYIALRSGGRTSLKQQTLSSLAGSLDPARFVRVHRSYLINLDRLERIEPYSKNSHVATLSDGSRIPVSREGHSRLRKLLGETR
jgi:two-component system LytT family response regulator